MSTKTYLGKRGSILKETSQQANLITLNSPILSGSSYDALTNDKILKNKTAVFSTTYIKNKTSLENSLIKLCEEIKKEIVEHKKSVIILGLFGANVDVGWIKSSSRKDKIIPSDQSIAIKDELLKRGIPVQINLFENEGHGFKDGKIKVDVLKKIEAFFRQNLNI